jgi:hypothetical protein
MTVGVLPYKSYFYFCVTKHCTNSFMSQKAGPLQENEHGCSGYPAYTLVTILTGPRQNFVGKSKKILTAKRFVVDVISRHLFFCEFILFSIGEKFTMQ